MASSGMRVYRRNNKILVTLHTDFGTTVLAILSLLPNRQLMFLELSFPAGFITHTKPEKMKHKFQSNTYKFKYEVKLIRVGHIH